MAKAPQGRTEAGSEGTEMVKFNHMGLPVADCQASRDWYVQNFGFVVEFEDLARRIIAIKDDADFTIFLTQPQGSLAGSRCSLTLQVDDVGGEVQRAHATQGRFREITRQVFLGLRRRA